MMEKAMQAAGFLALVVIAAGALPVCEMVARRADAAAAIREDLQTDLPAWKSDNEERECAMDAALFPGPEDFRPVP